MRKNWLKPPSSDAKSEAPGEEKPFIRWAGVIGGLAALGGCSLGGGTWRTKTRVASSAACGCASWRGGLGNGGWTGAGATGLIAPNNCVNSPGPAGFPSRDAGLGGAGCARLSFAGSSGWSDCVRKAFRKMPVALSGSVEPGGSAPDLGSCVVIRTTFLPPETVTNSQPKRKRSPPPPSHRSFSLPRAWLRYAHRNLHCGSLPRRNA